MAGSDWGVSATASSSNNLPPPSSSRRLCRRFLFISWRSVGLSRTSCTKAGYPGFRAPADSLNFRSGTGSSSSAMAFWNSHYTPRLTPTGHCDLTVPRLSLCSQQPAQFSLLPPSPSSFIILSSTRSCTQPVAYVARSVRFIPELGLNTFGSLCEAHLARNNGAEPLRRLYRGHGGAVLRTLVPRISCTCLGALWSGRIVSRRRCRGRSSRREETELTPSAPYSTLLVALMYLALTVYDLKRKQKFWIVRIVQRPQGERSKRIIAELVGSLLPPLRRSLLGREPIPLLPSRMRHHLHQCVASVGPSEVPGAPS